MIRNSYTGQHCDTIDWAVTWDVCALYQCPIQDPTSLSPTQFLANAPGKAADTGPSTWVHNAYMRNMDGDLGFWLHPSPASTSVRVWKANQQMDNLSLSPSLTPSLSLLLAPLLCYSFQINKWFFKKITVTERHCCSMDCSLGYSHPILERQDKSQIPHFQSSFLHYNGSWEAPDKVLGVPDTHTGIPPSRNSHNWS